MLEKLHGIPHTGNRRNYAISKFCGLLIGPPTPRVPVPTSTCISGYRFGGEALPNKRCPRPDIRAGALAGSAFAAEPDDQSEGAVQPAFSAISRPWIKQLGIMDTSS
ncbi:hypothetical protein SynA1544_02910 [Synechococcus sp. A15-44]|nr:hypothetical protein SynA1544_02910 [Synechococcus sp. A15-44]